MRDARELHARSRSRNAMGARYSTPLGGPSLARFGNHKGDFSVRITPFVEL